MADNVLTDNARLQIMGNFACEQCIRRFFQHIALAGMTFDIIALRPHFLDMLPYRRPGNAQFVCHFLTGYIFIPAFPQDL